MEGASRRGREGDEVIGTGWESQRRMLKCLELDPRILSSIRDWQWQMLIEPTLSNVLGTWFVQGREWWTWLTRNLCATLRCTDTVLCTSVPLAQYTGTVHIAIIFTRFFNHNRNIIITDGKVKFITINSIIIMIKNNSILILNMIVISVIVLK